MSAITPPNPRQIVGFGHRGRSGSARITFKINGVKLSAMIDTGFSGCISLPVDVAVKLNLKPTGLVMVVMADGAKILLPVAYCPVKFANRRRNGHVFIAPKSSIILVGMDFLRHFNLGLVVTKDLVVLVDEDWAATATKRTL